jgi:hypothetical protein
VVILDRREFKELVKKIEKSVEKIVSDLNKDIFLIEQNYGIIVCLSTSLEDLKVDVMGTRETVALKSITLK